MKKLILISTILFSFFVSKSQVLPEDTIPLPAIHLFAEANGNSSTKKIDLDFTFENESQSDVLIFARSINLSRTKYVNVIPGQFIDSTFTFDGFYGENSIELLMYSNNTQIYSHIFYVRLETDFYEESDIYVSVFGNQILFCLNSLEEQSKAKVFDVFGNQYKFDPFQVYNERFGFTSIFYPPKSGVYIILNTLNGVSKKINYIAR